MRHSQTSYEPPSHRKEKTTNNGYQVNADGHPTTAKRPLPAGAYNLLRAPYDVRRTPAPSAQDKAGRGLFISNPAPTGHADIFPHFQGNKTDMAARTSQAIRAIMPKAEREHYETVVDYFGGGGCWGLYHALENFPNAKYLVINEWDAGRIKKIELLHKLDGEVADRVKQVLTVERYEKLRQLCRVGENGEESGSGATIANKLGPMLKEFAEDELGILTAFCDCAHTMLANRTDESGKPSFDAGFNAVLDNLREDGRKAKQAADEFKARGGAIKYRQGDAASFHDAPRGDKVVAVCDPPYYLTAGYNGQTAVPLDAQGNGWDYLTTRNLLNNLVDSGDAIVYTDEAWWHKDSYAPNPSEGDDLFGNKSDFDREQETLLDIINSLDHFDVAGRVVGRQEVLGIHHGHDTAGTARNTAGSAVHAESEGRPFGDDTGRGIESSAADEGAGENDPRNALRDVAGGTADDDGLLGGAGAHRGREGRVALAREVIVQDITASLEAARPEGSAEAAPSASDTLARHSVRLVREERMADYARTVAKNAKRWLAKAQKDLDAHMAAHGYTEKVWHGTYGDDFNVFKFEDSNGHQVPAAYFTYRRETAQNYAAMRGMDTLFDGEGYDKVNTRQFYVNPGRVYDYDEAKTPLDFDGFVAMLKKAYADGYNAVRCRNVLDDQGARLDENDENMTFLDTEDAPGDGDGDFETDTLIVLQQPGDNAPARIKAADPVTFMDDTDGALPIPLEMRADQTLADVRFSVQRTTRLAPNGKRSNLTDRQYDQVRTPAFKAWFGDWESDPAHASKVLDENGEPLVVYHGTRSGGFSVFDEEYNRPYDDGSHDKGFFFTDKDFIAASYSDVDDVIATNEEGEYDPDPVARVDGEDGDRLGGYWMHPQNYAVFLNIRDMDTVDAKEHDWNDIPQGQKDNNLVSIYDLSDELQEKVCRDLAPETGVAVHEDEDGLWDNYDECFEAIEQYYRDLTAETDEYGNVIAEGEAPLFDKTTGEYTSNPEYTTTTRNYTNANLGKGNDGILFKDVVDHGNAAWMRTWGRRCSNVFVVKSPTQIKSATDNTGAFDSANPDVRFSVTVRRALQDLANTGTGVIHNANLGNIQYNTGKAGKGGFGLLHIVEQRMRKDGATLDEAIDTAIDVATAAEIGRETEHRHNTHHLDHNGTRAIVGVMPDKSIVITGYEIDTDESAVAKQRAAELTPRPHVRSEEVIRALKEKIASAAHIIPYSVAAAQGVRGNAPSVAPATETPAVDAIVADLKRRATTAQPRFSVHTAWRPDFPKAMAQTTRANIMAKYADLFNRAKAGDSVAAGELIEKVVKPEKVRELVRGHGEATIVMPIHAEEATGDNKLPIAYATYISDMTGLDYDDGIVQSVRAHHTGAGAERRLFVNPEFDGEVKRGREYIIVDDHITQGGTVNAMRDYIESNGGKVVAVSALTLSQGSSILSPQKETIDAIKRKWPDINRLIRAAGIADRVEALTESQCRYIQKFSADTFRARCLASGREGGVSVLPQTLGAPSEGVAREESQAERAAMRHSVFVGPKAAVKGAVDFDVLADAETTLLKKFHDNYTPEARDEIYRKTGWWRGTDGKWRFEIRDVKPKKRGMTRGDVCVNGLYEYGDRPEVKWCNLTDMVSHVKLFKAYPKLKDLTVEIVDPDSIDFNASCDPNRNRITLNWDHVEWFDDNPSNVLNDNGITSLTHELQHAVQYIEGYAKGGSPEYHGERNYERLAGEVEARNASRRIGYGEGGRAPDDGYEAWRERLLNANDAPWQTEDVPTAKQIIADEYGSMTDVHGRPVARHSVRRASNIRTDDLATALIASRRLAGKDMKIEDADKILRNLGLTDKAADVIARANALADSNREKLRGMVERHDPELVATLARQGLADRLGKSLDDLITGTANVTDPTVGARVQQAIQSKQVRDLMNAHGFDAAQMMAELPVDLAQAVFAVAEYEKTPEELARIEAARKKREEERAAEDGDEAAAATDDPVYREPTEEERAKLDALLDRARFMEEARKSEEERKKLAKKKKAADEGSAGDAPSSPDGEGADPGFGLPVETVRRIAPVFESADLFASFIVEWTADHVAEKHPNIPSTAEMWKNPVAVRELKQTATHILRKLAKDVLGSPSLNYARNFADHAINELESDAECKTFNAVRRKIARIYDQIHDHALSLSRRKMVKNLVKEIKKKAIERGRFSAVKEDLKRKIDAKTEQWCRWLVPALTMSEEKLQEEINRLTALVTVDPADEHATPEDKLREAADRLAVLHKYGGMVRWMPGKIADAEAEIMEMLDGKRQAFEARREEYAEKCKVINEAIIAAMMAGKPAKFRGEKAKITKWLESMQGDIALEMQNLIRFCPDAELREKAMQAFDEIRVWISEGGSRYRTVLYAAQEELNAGLKMCYGDAATGIKHLTSEKLPPEVAAKLFRNKGGKEPTYGQLLQLYATTIQGDYKENAEKHGRTEDLPLMEATLTDADRKFHAWAVEWYKHNRQTLSDAVEEVTGLPVTSPDALYCPAKMEDTPEGIPPHVIAWNPVPSQLNRRVKHNLDFRESANFFTCLDEQCEVRARTIGYAKVGILLRDTLASRAVREAAKEYVGGDDMARVVNHLRDILVQNAPETGDHYMDPVNIARKWTARFGISGNVSSMLAQPASIPVWANVMLGGKPIGLLNVMKYMANVDMDSVRELISDMGFKARYEMGWSEDVQNVIRNPSKNRVIRFIEKQYDRGMLLPQAMDKLCSLWIAQGFYRDATAHFTELGDTLEEAKRKARAITIAAVESTQQSARTENLNALQRKTGIAGSLARSIFQFKTAQLLSNNFIIQAVRDVQTRPNDKAAWGRLGRSLFISGMLVPAYMTLKNALWAAFLGDEPPEEDPDKWPLWFREMMFNAVDGVTAPIFFVSQVAETPFKQALGLPTYGKASGMPAVDSAIRIGTNLYKTVRDAFDVENDLHWEDVKADLDKIFKQGIAPYRHARKFYDNHTKE